MPQDDRVRFLRQLFDDAPGLVVLTRGPKHVYEYLNKAAVASSAYRADIIGKTLREARPELVEQGYGDLYDGVYRTGTSFVGHDARLVRVTADGTQAVGALLILGLLAAPAGAAHRLTAHPQTGIALASLLAVLSVWGGLALSYAAPALPPSTAIIGLAAAAYAAASLHARVRA